MAGDWIKMRGALLSDPKLIAVADLLWAESVPFRNWACPGYSGREPVLSDAALRCVTTGALLKLWSAAREHGKQRGDDLLLEHISIAHLDEMAGCPGLGKAMETVGWALQDGGVILPKFAQHNAPRTGAERQRAYRARNDTKRNARVTRRNARRVTSALPEKRREEKKNIPPISPPRGASSPLSNLREEIHRIHREALPWGPDWRPHADTTARALDVRLKALLKELGDENEVLQVFRRVFEYLASKDWFKEHPEHTHPKTWLRASNWDRYRDCAASPETGSAISDDWRERFDRMEDLPDGA